MIARSNRTIYVVRHAHAGQRTSVPGDEYRSLSEQGRRDAEQIGDFLAPLITGSILSSPYVRCVETLIPLAEHLHVAVEVRTDLAEGARADTIISLLAGLPENSVACAHGDTLLAVVEQLTTRGCHIEAPISFDKGVVWALAHDDGRCVDARVVHLPGPCGQSPSMEDPRSARCAQDGLVPDDNTKRVKNMAIDTFMAYAGVYSDVEAAEADYQAVHELQTELGLIDAYDAAVIERKENGKVKIVKKHETPTRAGGWGGAGVGLATGLVIALFPAAAIGGGLLAATTGGGAALGALAGHAAAGMSRKDLKELGESLDAGQAGLVVVAVSDMGAKIESAMSKADKIETKQLDADTDEIQKDAQTAG